MRATFFLTTLTLIGLAGAQAGAHSLDPSKPGDDAPKAGSLTGKVVFGGDVKDIPKAKVLDMSSKPEHSDHCLQADDKAERVMLCDPVTKGIANVFVEIRKVSKEEWTPDTEFANSDQKNCRFEPHVMVVPVGKEITFKNSDPFMHNVHFYCKKNAAANFGIPENGSKKVAFKSDEKIRVKCDVHPWMDSWIIATSNPYHALTATDGSFRIDNVPVGEYEIRFWHEKFGLLKKKKFAIGEGSTEVEIKTADPDWKA